MTRNPPIGGEPREGERRMDFDPAGLSGDARLVFIGSVRSPWGDRAECPKNMAQARERGIEAAIWLAPPYRAGLMGLDGFSHVAVLTWLDRSARDLIVQKPRLAEEPRGVFALRSPARPNPVGLHIAALRGIDHGAGVVRLEAIDVLDGTPVIDIKPYYTSTDAIPDAGRGGDGAA